MLRTDIMTMLHFAKSSVQSLGLCTKIDFDGFVIRLLGPGASGNLRFEVGGFVLDSTGVLWMGVL